MTTTKTAPPHAPTEAAKSPAARRREPDIFKAAKAVVEGATKPLAEMTSKELDDAAERAAARVVAAHAPATLEDSAEIELSEIIAPSNHRLARPDDAEKIAELAASMNVAGLQTPVRVYRREGIEGGYILGYGARRLAAAKRLGWTTIRADIYPPASEQEIERARATENLQRQDLNPAEEVVLVTQLLKLHNDNAAAVAHAIGRSETWVKDRRYLTRLCDRVLALVAGGELPLNHARQIAKLADAQDQESIAAQTINAEDWHTAGRRFTAAIDFDALRDPDRQKFTKSLEWVKRRVAETLRSLRVAPWRLDLPILAKVPKGKTRKLPPCVGCPHNTKSDPVLFDGGSATEDDAGTCASPECFALKTAAADAAKAELVKVTKKAKATTVAGAVDFARQAVEADEQAFPLRTDAATRFVKKELAPETAKKIDAPKGPTAKQREAMERRNAWDKHNEMVRNWTAAAITLVTEKLDPRVRVLVNFATDNLVGQDRHMYADWNPPAKGRKPAPPPAIGATAIAALDLALEGDTARLGEYAAKHKKLPPIIERPQYANPTLVVYLAKKLGVDIGNPPAWTEPAETTAAPAAKKKGGKA